MKIIKIKNLRNTRSCEYIAPQNFRCRLAEECPYPEDTAEYAVMRFLEKDPEFRDELVNGSIALRLETGKASKPYNRTLVFHPAYMEFPGTIARLTVRVSRDGIQPLFLEIA